MKIKLDENLSIQLAAILSAFGHDADTAAAEHLLSKPDIEVAQATFADQRMLFTLDLDFSDVRRYPPGTHPGIILFRPVKLGVKAVQQFVEGFVASTDLNALAGCRVVVTPAAIRIRRPETQEPS